MCMLSHFYTMTFEKKKEKERGKKKKTVGEVVNLLYTVFMRWNAMKVKITIPLRSLAFVTLV